MKILGKIKGSILDLANWSQRHLEKLIVLIGVCILFFVLFVLMSWGVGFYANGIGGFKFDLGSIWQGLAACVTAIGSLLSIAGVNLGKHYIDSKFNSGQGSPPGRRGE